MAFNYTPSDGLSNVSSYITVPATNAQARQQFMDLFNQVRDYINNTLDVTSGTDDARVIKNDNGQMEIDMKIVLGSTPVTTANGTWYMSGALALGNFPVAFVSTPIVETPLAFSSAGTQLTVGCSVGPTATSLPTIAVNRANSITLPDLTVYIIAKGRWK